MNTYIINYSVLRLSFMYLHPENWCFKCGIGLVEFILLDFIFWMSAKLGHQLLVEVNMNFYLVLQFFSPGFSAKKKVTSLSSIEVVLCKSTKHKTSTSWWRCGYGLLYDALKFSKKYIYFDACICDRICFIQVGKKGHKFLGGGGHGTLRTFGTFVWMISPTEPIL